MPPTATKASVMYPDDISGLLCLPPVSDDLQVLWTQAELTEDLDDHPQLMNTFSFFPYPSLPEIALLSLRYGLQMEKVKNWFMVQRIRCGISWTPEEIEETRSRLNYTQEQLHFKPLIALAKKSNVLKTEEFPIRVPKLCTKPGIMPTSPGNNEAPYKRMRLSSKFSEKEHRRFSEGTTEHHVKRSSRDVADNSKHSSAISNVHPKKRPMLSPVKPSGAGLIFAANGQETSPDASYIPSEGERAPSWNRNNGEAAQLAAYYDQNESFRREDYNASARRQRKSKEQLSILKSFFLKCQWATREDYMMLEDITGLPRADIIQWFGDTRYALKHGNLRWFRDITQDPPSWEDDTQHPDNLNGAYSESNSPAQELDSSMTDMPVEDLTASSSRHLLHTVEKEEDIDPEPTSSAKSRHRVSNSKLQVTNCSTPKNSRKSSTPSSLQRKYEILEDFWCSSQDLREGDLQKLVKETGLSRQQIVDWFTYKSKESDEVEICVVEDKHNDGEEDDEDDTDDDDEI